MHIAPWWALFEAWLHGVSDCVTVAFYLVVRFNKDKPNKIFLKGAKHFFPNFL